MNFIYFPDDPFQGNFFDFDISLAPTELENRNAVPPSFLPHYK